MGNSTIIELNHDCMDEIFGSQQTEQEFLNSIHRQLNTFELNGKRILGGQVILGCHRQDKAYEWFTKFKKKVSY